MAEMMCLGNSLNVEPIDTGSRVGVDLTAFAFADPFFAYFFFVEPFLRLRDGGGLFLDKFGSEEELPRVSFFDEFVPVCAMLNIGQR